MNDYRYTVYLAGPITGKTYAMARGWKEQARNLLDPAIAGVDPLRAKNYLAQASHIKDTYDEIALSSAKGITTRDMFDCRRCDMILANLSEATQISIGTVMEIAWGRAFNKPTVVVMDESNVHWHAMIRESVGFIVPTVEEACHIVNAVLLPYPEVIHQYVEPKGL